MSGGYTAPDAGADDGLAESRGSWVRLTALLALVVVDLVSVLSQKADAELSAAAEEKSVAEAASDDQMESELPRPVPQYQVFDAGLISELERCGAPCMRIGAEEGPPPPFVFRTMSRIGRKQDVDRAIQAIQRDDPATALTLLLTNLEHICRLAYVAANDLPSKVGGCFFIPSTDWMSLIIVHLCFPFGLTLPDDRGRQHHPLHLF